MGRLALIAGLIATAVILNQPAAAARPLRTGIVANAEFTGPGADVAFARTNSAGATIIRIGLDWGVVARRRPANPADPADPAYDWAAFDRAVRLALAHGLEPVVSIEGAPPWAQDTSAPLPFVPAAGLIGPIRPDPAAYGVFARAAATRYSGSFAGLPRLRYWRAWNEPNLSLTLLPQFVGTRAVSVVRYRQMVNAFADAVHGVHLDNVVVAGSLAGFGSRTKFVEVVAPLRFMRELLCLSSGRAPKATCADRVHFDAWAVQPYTSGGPTRESPNPNNVSLGDLPDVRALLRAGVSSGHLLSHGAVRFWVTEFGWDTRPPDLNPHVVPIKLHARWVAEALYRSWLDGVTVFTWFQLRDSPFVSGSPAQGGLYFRGENGLQSDAPKPALAAFRFPFVAYRQADRYLVWGRTPAGRAAVVAIERNAGRGWRRIATMRADRYGIFSGSPKAPAVRARERAAAPQSTVQAQAYRAAVMRDSPTSYWPLDETTGTHARDLTGVRSGVYEGGAKRGVAGALPGTLNAAVSLDGKNDRVSLGPIASPRTVELWLKSSAEKEAAGFSNRDAESRYTFLGVAGAVHARGFDSFGLSGRTWITDGRWHHLVYTYDGALGRLYVDGRLDSSGAWSRVEGGAAAYLGYDATLKTHLRGSIDEVALYPYALTPAQIRAHFLATGRPLAYGGEFALMNGRATYLRARLIGARGSSLPFSLTRPPDRFVLPFGV